MVRTLKLIPLFCLVLVLLALPARATECESVSITDLVSDPLGFDGHTVTVRGEAIGQALRRGNYAWVNLSDGGNALGIWITLADAGKIAYYGDYRHTGDTVEVTGVFHRDCEEHGGDVDIHCQLLRDVSPGQELDENISPAKAAAALILTLAATPAAVFCLRAGRAAPKQE